MKVSKIFVVLITMTATHAAMASAKTSIEPKKEVIVKADGGCPLAKGPMTRIFDSTNPPTSQAPAVKSVEAVAGADSKVKGG